MSDRAAHWDGRYAEGAEGLSWFEPAPERSLELLERAGLGPSMSVVDVGGGASGLAAELVARGHQDVTVVDVSAEALALARLGMDEPEAVTWVRADVLAWEPDRTWDAWHDRAVFHFLVAPEQRAVYRSLLARAVAPGGIVVVQTFAEDGPEACSGLPVQRWSPEALADELAEVVEPLEVGRHVHATPWGAEQRFAWLVGCRSGRPTPDGRPERAPIRR